MGFSLDEIDWGMAEAASQGHINIVQLMLSRGANATGLTSAASGGHQNIIELMLSRGTTNHNHAMSIAAFYGHESIARLLLDHWN